MLRKLIVAATLLLMLGVASISADNQDFTALGFGRWLDKVQAKSTAVPSSVAPAYDYDDVEVLHTCLEEGKQQNCLPGSTGYFESLVTCCGGRSKGDELVLEPTIIGQCDFTVFRYSSVEVAPQVTRRANFLALCTFEKKADECGEPFCDKMVLSVQGQTYQINNAFLSSNPSPPAYDELCGGYHSPRHNDTQQLPGQQGKKSQQVTAKTAYEPYHEAPSYYEDTKNYYPTKTLYKAEYARVFYGPFTVNSRSHSVKYEQGWFSYVPDAVGAVPTIETDVHDAHVLDAFKYKLSFIKDKTY